RQPDGRRLWRIRLRRRPYDRQPHQAASQEVQGDRRRLPAGRDAVRRRLSLPRRRMTAEVDRDVVAAPVLTAAEPAAAAVAPARSRQRRHRFWSPLTLRILALNMMPLLVLFTGASYLDRYQKSLVQSELDALQMQAGLVAIALG